MCFYICAFLNSIDKDGKEDGQSCCSRTFLKVYETSHTELGLFMLVWTLYTSIMLIASLRVNKAMAITFGLLLMGFILLVNGLLGNPIFIKIAGYELIFCALGAWFMMAAIIINDLAGKTVVPVGKAFY